jgi:predicted TIM-barrel fold metal-dependent hydrolase
MDRPSVSRRDFLAAGAWTLAGAALARGTAPSPRDEPILDIHQHTNYGGRRDPSGKEIRPGRTDDELLAHQRAMGATRTILLPAGREVDRDSTHQGKSNGLQGTCGGNESCQKLARNHPEAFSFGANEVPDLPEAPEIVEKALKAGAVVIGEQKFSVECDSPPMQKLYALAETFRVPVLMHWQHGMYNHGIERFGKMLERYPKVTFIGHAQTWWANIDKEYKDPTVLYPKTKVTPGGLTDRYLADYPNMFGDLSASSGQGALSRDPDHAREFLKRHQDKLFFGSDCNDLAGAGEGCIGARTIGLIRELSPTKEIERKILFENAKKVFRL